VRAPLLVLLTSVSCFSTNDRVFAGPFSAQPLVGVAAEYASNPELVASAAQSETHAALFVDLPMNYDLDAVHFSVTPRVRYGGATGYSSVTSNYYHLDASAQFTNELGSFTCTGSLYRDSSLLYAGELSNGAGVRRDTSSADVNWQRALSERLQFQFDANTSRTLYAQNTASTDLVDYRYTSLSPSLAYAVDERDTLQVLGGVGRYKSLDGFTDSDNNNLQLGFNRQLSEMWKLTTSAGYSKSTNQYHYFFGTFEIVQRGGVYSANLTRQSDVLSVTTGVSRAFTPTGSVFLSRQDSVTLLTNYSYSERWTFGLSATWQNVVDPVVIGASERRRFYDGDVFANWRWTEQWTLTLHVLKIGQQFAPQPGKPLVSPGSDDVRLEISRQFYRTNQ
jgi:hypothetical protein